jgi:hypothetical protein
MYKKLVKLTLFFLVAILSNPTFVIGQRLTKVGSKTSILNLNRQNELCFGQDKGEPTAEETIQWMNIKIGDVVMRNCDSHSEIYWDYSGKVEVEYFGSDTRVYKFDLKNINPKSINHKITKAPCGEYYAYFTFNCNQSEFLCVNRYDEVLSSKKYNKENAKRTSGVSIIMWKPYKEKNLVKRFTKALKHLIKLRGGGGETF